jgi:hypothetical protein
VLVGLDLAVDLRAFLEEGRHQAAFIKPDVRPYRAYEGIGAVVDFGGGCGRVARWFADSTAPSSTAATATPDW